MPELPEVESIVRDLRKPISGRIIVYARMLNRAVYRTGSQSLKRIAGSKIITVERFGKAILFRMEPPRALVIHLGMTGNLGVVSIDDSQVAVQVNYMTGNREVITTPATRSTSRSSRRSSRSTGLRRST